METREFPTAVIASLSSGVSLCSFDKMHEAAEYLMGHPIWTHHFASEDLWKAMQRKVLEQCPGMPSEIEGVTPENYRERIAVIEFSKFIGIAQFLRLELLTQIACTASVTVALHLVGVIGACRERSLACLLGYLQADAWLSRRRLS